MFVKTFQVNQDEYNLAEHHHLLITTEYTQGNSCISKQVIYKSLYHKIFQKLNLSDNTALKPEEERYYIRYPEYGKLEEITFEKFIRKLNEFAQNNLNIVEECCELYDYLDKNNNPASAWITVLKENDALTQAKIEFKSNDDLKNFVLPKWLRE